MSTFTPTPLEKYNKHTIPDSDVSMKRYLDEQFAQLDKSTRLSVDAIKQLQDEMTLIWNALTALGQPRP